MENKQNTINSRAEVIQIVDSFYAKVRLDPVIGPIFTVTAKVDWNEHLPKLYNFWEDLLFGTDHYKGRPFPPHMKLNLEPQHFEIWLKLFTETIDESYQGLKAEEMKARARRIALNFATNLGLK